jgi:single-strand DNA-binding protein
MVNKVTLIGNLGRDPEVRTLENGTKVGSFTLATNENYKDKNDQWQSLTEWHNIVVWRYQAEKAERELKKGSLAYVEGKITHRKYQDKDGVERFTTEIVAAQVYSLERKENPNRQEPMPTLDSQSSQIDKSGDERMGDDLPF